MIISDDIEEDFGTGGESANKNISFDEVIGHIEELLVGQSWGYT